MSNKSTYHQKGLTWDHAGIKVQLLFMSHLFIPQAHGSHHLNKFPFIMQTQEISCYQLCLLFTTISFYTFCNIVYFNHEVN